MSKRHGVYLLTGIIVLIILVGTASFFYFGKGTLNNVSQEPDSIFSPKAPGLGNLCSFSSEYNCRIFCDENRKECEDYFKEHPDN